MRKAITFVNRCLKRVFGRREADAGSAPPHSSDGGVVPRDLPDIFAIDFFSDDDVRRYNLCSRLVLYDHRRRSVLIPTSVYEYPHDMVEDMDWYDEEGYAVFDAPRHCHYGYGFFTDLGRDPSRISEYYHDFIAETTSKTQDIASKIIQESLGVTLDD